MIAWALLGCCPLPAQAAKRAVVHALITELEAQNPVPDAMDNLAMVAGNWKLLYSTITITVRLRMNGHSV